jgi:TolB protein
MPAFEARGEEAALNISNHPLSDSYPTWSPEGAYIAYVSNRAGNRDIFIVRPDGTGQFNVSLDSSYDSNPLWSPDGRYLAFSSYRDGNPELYVVDIQAAVGSGLPDPINLTKNDGYDGLAAWQP